MRYRHLTSIEPANHTIRCSIDYSNLQQFPHRTRVSRPLENITGVGKSSQHRNQCYWEPRAMDPTHSPDGLSDEYHCCHQPVHPGPVLPGLGCSEYSHTVWVTFSHSSCVGMVESCSALIGQSDKLLDIVCQTCSVGRENQQFHK